MIKPLLEFNNQPDHCTKVEFTDVKSRILGKYFSRILGIEVDNISTFEKVEIFA